MLKKIINKIKVICTNNYKFFLILLATYFICTFNLPYYIETPGGIIDVNKRFTIDNGLKKEGSLNLAYVGELKATIPTYIIAKLNKNWDLIKKEEALGSEESETVYYRDKMMLDEANNDALKYVFDKANKEYSIVDNKIYITYIDESAKTDLKIKDQIIEVNGNKFKNKEELNKYIKTIDENTKITFKVINNKKEYTRYAYTQNIDGMNIIGIFANEIETIKTKPKITFKFKSSESGSSGGLMMSLAIYNALVDEDLTRGRTIVGTGTLDEIGNVGEIDGVKYKLKAAVSKKADIFLVPSGDNYKDALKEKKKNNYNIDIVSVSTFDEALEYLLND